MTLKSKGAVNPHKQFTVMLGPENADKSDISTSAARPLETHTSGPLLNAVCFEDKRQTACQQHFPTHRAGGVTVPRGVQETWYCGTWYSGHGGMG